MGARNPVFSLMFETGFLLGSRGKTSQLTQPGFWMSEGAKKPGFREVMAGTEWVQETRFQGGGWKPGFWQGLGGKPEDEGNPVSGLTVRGS